MRIKIFYVESNGTPPPCPVCRARLVYRDRKPRILKSEGGSRQWLMIRRFRCSGCGRYHNELPDCLVPYKHYEAEAISGVIDGVVTSDDLDSEDYPCVYTMLLWIRWFTGNLERIEGYLRSVAYELSDYDQEVLYSQVPLLESIRHRSPCWLEQIIRSVYNSGGFLLPVYY
ncbi:MULTISPECIES: DUF6431 domain-containing protein [Lachnospiraceae]|jgi:hypothetical protein|uniref:DUF6431 domain-containing protein n=1 Tax=Lachnospiraceae TaxID=186803 RepID=UPI0024313DEB|nr:DUF6431 domain-containing protein [Blautia massiliensis (ex Durand et al. 2017)]MDD6547663.1 DUF6431 domain-containing protein [Blautia massiliensis (ex Durand et al. 2017)]